MRFLVLLPWMTPVALSTIAWLWMLDSVFTPIDWIVADRSGCSSGNLFWLGRPDLAMVSVIAVHVWRITPLATVIMMAGLTAIPRDIKDAAHVDGAGFWRRTFEIIDPADAAGHGRRRPVRGDLHVHRHDGRRTSSPAAGRPIAPRCSPAGRSSRASTGGDLAQGAAVALFLFPLLLAAAIAILLAVRRMEVR